MKLSDHDNHLIHLTSIKTCFNFNTVRQKWESINTYSSFHKLCEIYCYRHKTLKRLLQRLIFSFDEKLHTLAHAPHPNMSFNIELTKRMLTFLSMKD